MAVRKDRIIAWFFAIIFIVSTLALAVTVIISVLQDNNQSVNNGATTTPSDQNNETQENAVSPEQQLQGKPLAGFTPVDNISELQKIDVEPGTGEEVKAGDSVTAHYTGAVASTGVVFQSSYDSGSPVPFSLDQVIAGWSQGVPGMKEGGTRRLLIPANLAYGGNPPPNSGIPANADLVFDIKLESVDKQ